MPKRKETLTDLRRKRRKGIKLTMKERFRLLASKASKRYHKTGWSSWEESFREVFTSWRLKEHIHWEHNYPIFNTTTGRFYFVDFVLFGSLFKDGRARAIEISPKLYHKKLGNVEERDRKKKKLLKRLGFKYIAFGTEIKLESKTRRIKKSDREMMRRIIYG